jgi:diguanylate cyclase (GGDEF)-like protein/PAS domain S-box-containing protein
MYSSSTPRLPTAADTHHPSPRFEQLVNRIDGIIWEADPATLRFTFVSAQAERILGYRVEDWYADGFRAAHLHPQDRARALSDCVAQTRGEQHHALEYRMLAADGREVWLKDFVSVNHATQPPILCGVMVVITERVQTQQALQLSASVFESSAEGIMITDASKRILQVNRAFSTITGYEAAEVLGQTPAVLQSGDLFSQHLSIRRVQDRQGSTTHYIGTFNDLSDVKAAAHKIERLSHFDALTDLPNWALLQERLQQALMTAQRRQCRVALLKLDIERLRHINDTLGHHIGDKVIVAVAQRLVASVRAQDTVARHRGDEFAVILEDLHDAQAAAAIAAHVLAALGSPLRIDEHEIDISACIGISLFPDDGQSPLMLLKYADVALHHAKGSSSFQLFREEMNAASMERMLIQNSLRLALQRQEFRVAYQAQLDFASGRILGMEALVRWVHPELGLVSPARFIQVAEASGQIVEIGLWVLRTACEDTRRWHAQGHRQLRVAVNVSARQFNEDNFAAQVQQILQETGLAPEWLELELTESLIMQRPERVIGTMQELRRLGVTFSIDDFGTGYSSLSQLKRFPIDKLKIDQSFTRDIGLDEDGAAITRAVIALGTSLRLQVVAEGVETEEQQRFLIANGCHSMQGYLFSRPIPAADFTSLLEQHAAHDRDA